MGTNHWPTSTPNAPAEGTGDGTDDTEVEVRGESGAVGPAWCVGDTAACDEDPPHAHSRAAPISSAVETFMERS